MNSSVPLKYSPSCENKYVFLDQGGELYSNPDLKNVFSNQHYDIYPKKVQIVNIRIALLREHTVQLVIMFVYYLLVLIYQSSSGAPSDHTSSFVTFLLLMPLLLRLASRIFKATGKK